MTSTRVPVTSLTVGDITVLGTITHLETSLTGKTVYITVSRPDGTIFTDRIAANGAMSVFTP
jgi:hypothetical protein